MIKTKSPSRSSSRQKGPSSSLSLSSWFQPHHGNVLLRNRPAVVSFSSDHDRTRYLQIHQSARKQRAIRRFVEITSILFGQVLRPLVCSLVSTITTTTTQKQLPDAERFTNDWDAFWSQKSTARSSSSSSSQKKKKSKLTHAQRVAEGFQQLGPTYVKLGQLLASRPDLLQKIPALVPLVDALTSLQDNMRPFDNLTAKRILRQDLMMMMRRRKQQQQQQQQHSFLNNDDDDASRLQAFVRSLPDEPVAAASMSQVYKGFLPEYGGAVAVKVQRPGIRGKVEKDATLFHSLAAWLETKWPTTKTTTTKNDDDASSSSSPPPFVKTVDEFTARILEEMDFEQEARNMQAFADLYSHRRGRSSMVRVVVPEIVPELCSSRVIVMEWLEGTKLTDICEDCDDRQEAVEENLALVVKAIECTISQLLDTGLVHADPHAGNLLKVKTADGATELGYLDFGLISHVPQEVRDGIVCAVVQVVFAHNIEAVADLCVDLGMLPREKLQDPFERRRLVGALKQAFDKILVWPRNVKGRATEIPRLRFERLPDALADLVSSFEFEIPPYFFNNARALATLEGIALKLDPSFNILRVIYPFAINRLMRNPSISSVVKETFMDICRSPETRLFDPHRGMMLLNDWALITGYRKRKIFWDLATSAGWRRVSWKIMREWYHKRARLVQRWYRERFLLLLLLPRFREIQQRQPRIAIQHVPSMYI